jgi:hypothetical protein
MEYKKIIKLISKDSVRQEIKKPTKRQTCFADKQLRKFLF